MGRVGHPLGDLVVEPRQGNGRRDPDDERQVVVSLTAAGRKLREKGLTMDLVEASGLAPEEFAKVQKAVVTLRTNLLEHVKQNA